MNNGANCGNCRDSFAEAHLVLKQCPEHFTPGVLEGDRRKPALTCGLHEMGLRAQSRIPHSGNDNCNCLELVVERAGLLSEVRGGFRGVDNGNIFARAVQGPVLCDMVPENKRASVGGQTEKIA
jgi:hypothetical protein